jgi:hypothetical protein
LAINAFKAVSFYSLQDLAEGAGQRLGEEDTGFAKDLIEQGPAFSERTVF